MSRNMAAATIPKISAAQFAAAFALRPNLVTWFLGAGASAASNIPTGYAIDLLPKFEPPGSRVLSSF